MWAASARECFNDARAAIRRWPLNEALHSQNNEVLHQPAGGEDASSSRTSTSYEPQSIAGWWRVETATLCEALIRHAVSRVQCAQIENIHGISACWARRDALAVCKVGFRQRIRNARRDILLGTRCEMVRPARSKRVRQPDPATICTCCTPRMLLHHHRRPAGLTRSLICPPSCLSGARRGILLVRNGASLSKASSAVAEHLAAREMRHGDDEARC